MNIKKLCTILVAMVMFTVVANAQKTTKSVTKPAKSVTKFLGIPVDGSLESMRQKLIEKGFKFIDGSDTFDRRSGLDPINGGALTGIFNNEHVHIIIHGNPYTQKVWRIVVSNQNEYSKDEVIRKFNDLVRQFDAKRNYTRGEHSYLLSTYYISDDVDDEDFDRNVEKYNYLAHYYQGNDKMKLVWFDISKQSNSDKYDITIYYENLYNELKPDEYLCPH